MLDGLQLKYYKSKEILVRDLFANQTWLSVYVMYFPDIVIKDLLSFSQPENMLGCIDVAEVRNMYLLNELPST